MPPRSTPPPPRASVFPSNDSATYRDLLYFEERLKTNAARLQRRKARYQLFLFQLLMIISFLLVEVLLPPDVSVLAIPWKFVLQRALPNIYTPDVQVRVHPYFSTGLLFVSVTTLVLFFASGMYSEKIAYANKYVPHANRALRSFNMYFNVRKPPLRSKFYLNPLSYLFPRPEEPSNPTTGTSSPSPSSNVRPPSSTLPIPSIPPASNPRGELIFSSRVDRIFREAYERYRAQFERRREEKEAEERKRWWQERLSFWKKSPPALAGSVSVTPATRTGLRSPRSPSLSSTSSLGKITRSATPPMAPGGTWGRGLGNVLQSKDRSVSPSPTRHGSPPRDRGRRERGNGQDMRTFALEKSLS